MPYVFPESAESNCPPLTPIEEIVFFGRLEVRKGLEIFVDAIQHLPKSLKVSLVGKDTTLPGGQSAAAYIETRLRGRRVTLFSKFDRDQVARVSQGGRSNWL